MVTSLFTASSDLRNNTLRFCFILTLVAAFAALPCAAQQSRMTTVVRADAKTGRLVRSSVMEPRVISSRLVADFTPSSPEAGGEYAADQNLDELIDRIAGEQGVETHLVHSVIRAESNYNSNALSPKGAQGIMQLIPATARRFGVSNAFDPSEKSRAVSVTSVFCSTIIKATIRRRSRHITRAKPLSTNTKAFLPTRKHRITFFRSLGISRRRRQTRPAGLRFARTGRRRHRLMPSKQSTVKQQSQSRRLSAQTVAFTIGHLRQNMSLWRILRTAAILGILPALSASNSGLIQVTSVRSWSHSDSIRLHARHH